MWPGTDFSPGSRLTGTGSAGVWRVFEGGGPVFLFLLPPEHPLAPLPGPGSALAALRAGESATGRAGTAAGTRAGTGARIWDGIGARTGARIGAGIGAGSRSVERGRPPAAGGAAAGPPREGQGSIQHPPRSQTPRPPCDKDTRPAAGTPV